MNFVKINDSNVFEGYSVIKKIDKKLTSKGSYFLDLTLADKSGEINAKLWDYKETPQNVFNIHDLVKVRGTYVPFNDQMQFRIDRIRLDRTAPSARCRNMVDARVCIAIGPRFERIDVAIAVC